MNDNDEVCSQDALDALFRRQFRREAALLTSIAIAFIIAAVILAFWE